jgi:hypothetical protein
LTAGAQLGLGQLHRPAVMGAHHGEESTVEPGAVQGLQPLQLPPGQHARQQRRGMVAAGIRSRPLPSGQPRPHAVGFGGVAGGDRGRQLDKLRSPGPASGRLGHADGLLMVGIMACRKPMSASLKAGG